MNRRTFLSTITSSTAAIGLAGCSALQSTPRASFSGNVLTGEPLVTGTDVSVENPYPPQYSAVIASEDEAQERIRWEYIENDLPPLARKLREADYDSEVQILFGMVLPETKMLEPETSSVVDGTIRQTYRIEQTISGASVAAINTSIVRLRTDTRPDVEFAVIVEDKASP